MGAHLKIRTEKTGHYYTHGTMGSKTRFVWICLHGYGQLARYFIQRFQFLDPDLHYVIAPEGLSRFYFEGVTERPVASWMTREDRLDEIADLVVFLNLLRTKTSWDKCEDVKVIYLGFSQGVTTLMRWLHNATPRVDFLLMWAGGLPEDISFEHQRAYFKNMSAHYFIGDKDPYFNQETITQSRPLIDSIGFDPTIHYFQGAHTVDEITLKDWVTSNLS